MSVGLVRRLIRKERELTEAKARRPDGKQAAIDRLRPMLRLTTIDSRGYVVPTNNTIKRPVTLSINTWSIVGGEGSVPPYLEVTSYGGGVDKHRETPGNGPYREALKALWDVVYPPKENPDPDDLNPRGKLFVSAALDRWSTVEELLVAANDEKTELEKVKVIPRETPAQRRYMDHSYTNEEQFIKAAAEHLMLKDMGQEPWSIDKDEFISEFGEDEYYEALKDYASDAHGAIDELIKNDEPATMRNLERLLRPKKPTRRG